MKPAFSKTNKELLLQERTVTIDKTDERCFSDFIKDKRKLEVGPSGKKGITTRELAKRLDIDYEHFRKILNMNKPTKKRDCIIAICAALRLDAEETNEALVLYQYMPILDTNNPRDDLLITILEEQLSNPLTIDEINQRLVRNGLPELDIIDHRPSAKPVSEKVTAPYKLLRKHVQTFSADLLLGDPYDSLETEYSIHRYRCVAVMLLSDTKHKKIYRLTADTQNNFTIEVPDKQQFEIKVFKSVGETGVFKDYYLELEAMATHELKKVLCILNDTKNYQTRNSAGIANDSLHVYAETFNYTVPELSEYYLFEYKNGSTLFSVFQNSEFMHLYLRPDEFASTYGKNTNTLIAQYNSVEEILSNKPTANNINEDLLRCRYRYFKKLKDQVDNLIIEIKSGKKYIRHLDYIYEDWDRVCEFFGVEKEFSCAIDDLYGEMMYAEKRSADFRFEDCGSVNITIEDLYKAFELGFTNINEICRVKKKLGSIEQILNQFDSGLI